MKHSTQRTAWFAIWLLILSCALLWGCLTAFGAYPGGGTTQAQELTLFENTALPNVTEEDYALYPVFNVNASYSYGVLPALDYILPAEDAAVLGGKHVRTLLGHDLRGSPAQLFYTFHRVAAWDIYCSGTEMPPDEMILKRPFSDGYFYSVDAVSGALIAFAEMSKFTDNESPGTDEGACVAYATEMSRAIFPELGAEAELKWESGYYYHGFPFGATVPMFCVRVSTGADRYSTFLFSNVDGSLAAIDLQGYFEVYPA